MSESQSEKQNNPNNPTNPKRISQESRIGRRELMKTATLMAIGAAIGKRNPKPPEKAQADPSREVMPYVPPLSQPEQPQRAKEFPRLFQDNGLFSAYDEKSQKFLHAEIKEEMKRFLKEKDFASRKRQTEKLHDKIYKTFDYLKGKDPSINTYIKDFFPALIFLESGGNSRAQHKGSGAKGLSQLTAGAMKDMVGKARSLGITVAGDPFHEDTNITLGMLYLDYLIKNYHDPVIATWAYHLGIGNMNEAVKTHLMADLKSSETEIMSAMEDINKGPGYLIKHYDIDFADLVTSKNVLKRLKELNAANDETDKYVPRLFALDTFLRF